MPVVQFNWTVDLGTMIQLTVLVSSIFVVYLRVKERIISLETKVDLIYQWWKQQVGAME